MLDLKFIRENAELVRKAIHDKGDKADLDALLALDVTRRELIGLTESARAEQNKVTLQIAEMKKAKQDATAVIAEMRAVSDRIKEYDEKLRAAEEQIYAIQIRIPNIPHESVPVGDPSHNQIVKQWGKIEKKDFTSLPHYEIAEKLNLVDFNRASRIAGASFVGYRGLGAKLERSLINFMLDLHIEKHGYTEVSPPFVTKRESMFGTGQLPKLEEDMYHITADDLFLIPTAEVPVTNLHREEVLDGEDLPILYTAYTPCFRREAGAYGKDTRGLVRIHQFDKVEMVKFVRPETSYDELEKLLGNAEEVLQLLELPYRVVALATGDLSFSAAKCYDLEVWMPGQGEAGEYKEISSCSNFTDFQARRGGIRFKPKSGKSRLVHTLNGSGVAIGRTVAAILENYQNEDGTVSVPQALIPYMNDLKRIT